MAPAITALMLVAEYGGSTMMARIGVMRPSHTTAGMPRSVQEKNKIYRIAKMLASPRWGRSPPLKSEGV
jgi:hypothetical protein